MPRIAGASWVGGMARRLRQRAAARKPRRAPANGRRCQTTLLNLGAQVNLRASHGVNATQRQHKRKELTTK